jgi:hypothetical protein
MNQRALIQSKLLFLFGAGSSIPAGVKSTDNLTEWLVSALDHDPFLATQDWLRDLWKVICHHARLSSLVMGPYQPNFEHLVYAIELMEDYLDVFRIPDKDYVDAIKEFGKRAQLHNDVEAYSAASYSLLPITLDARSTNPISLQVNIKGSSAKFMWAARAIRRLLADQIPSHYDLNYLEPFKETFSESPGQITIATTNYDLVFDKFFSTYGIPFDDGFEKGAAANTWNGFCKEEATATKYLKLHGSMDWFQIKKEWFNTAPQELSPNDIYKVEQPSVAAVLKRKLTEKGITDQKYRFEFDVPHLILGGNKDRKILDVPYVEIHREWTYQLSNAETIVFVGVGGFDFHLLQQVRGLIATNRTLNKIIIVNPNWDSHKRLAAFLSSPRIRRDVRFFHIETNWDMKVIESQYKRPFLEMLTMSAEDLYAHYKSELNA